MAQPNDSVKVLIHNREDYIDLELVVINDR